VTDPTEQTAGEALFDTFAANHVENGFVVGGIERLEFKRDAVLACIALGIDSDQPVAQLRADLAIAARARACASDERFDNVDGPDGRTFYTPERLLAYLLNGEQP
jgi:hypothetical protein